MSLPEQLDARSTEELIQASLEGDDDDEDAWAAIGALHRRGTRDVLEAALRLLGEHSVKSRERGALLIGQLGLSDPTLRRERGDALLDLLMREKEPSVLQSAGIALMHLVEPRALSALIQLAHHPSAEARYGAVHGLGVLDTPEATQTLIRLSTDEDRDVRDWATFCLGSLQEGVDTPELRAALAARLEDEDSEIFGEALAGLARRKDPRAVEPVRKALGGKRVDVYALEAAASLGDPSFHPLLLTLRDSITPEADPYFVHVLHEVIAQFNP